MPTRIIVEVCQNHNGDRGLLKEMIAEASAAGADIIKGQIIFSEDLVPRERFETGRMEANGVRKAICRPYGAERERLAKLDLNSEDYHFFVEECHRAGVKPMLTILARCRIPLAAALPWREKLIKVASYDCASHPMIRELAEGFDRLIISTGATFDDEITETAKLLSTLSKPFAYLHCVTSYPNVLSECNLARMLWLRSFTPEVGWSDHTLTRRDQLKAAKVAILLGADYVERHFTILPAEATKDGPVSIAPELLAELTAFNHLSVADQRAVVSSEIPEWRRIIGQAERALTHTEMLNRDYYRGRFASFLNDRWINNWENSEISAA